MASYLNNLLLFDDQDWSSEPSPDERDGMEPYLDDDGEEFEDELDHMKLPEIIGILPIRNTVVYPGTVTHLAVGRERSKALLADVEPNDAVIGLLTQRNPDTDRPGFGDLYSVGTTASVLKTIKMPQGSLNIVVHGIAR